MADEYGRMTHGSRYTRPALASADVEGDLSKRLYDTESRETKLQAMLAIERNRVQDERQKSEAKEEEISRLLEELSASNHDGIDVQRKLDEAAFRLHISDTHRQDLADTLSQMLEANRRVLEHAFDIDVTSKGDVGITLAAIHEARHSGSQKRVVVDALTQDGPAMTSGKIRVGDTISTIRGLETSSLRVEEMRILLEGPHGTPVTITGTRGKSAVSFAITLIRSNGSGILREQSEEVCRQIDRMRREIVQKKNVIYFERRGRDVVIPWRVWANNRKRIKVAERHVAWKTNLRISVITFADWRVLTLHSRRIRNTTERILFRVRLSGKRLYFQFWLSHVQRKQSLRHFERVLSNRNNAMNARSALLRTFRGWATICQERERLQVTEMWLCKRQSKKQLSCTLIEWLLVRRRSQTRRRLAVVLSGVIKRHLLATSLVLWRALQEREQRLVSTHHQVSRGLVMHTTQAAFSAWMAVVYENTRALSLSVVVARSANKRRYKVVLRAWASLTQIANHNTWLRCSGVLTAWLMRLHETRSLMMLFTAISRISNRHSCRFHFQAWAETMLWTKDAIRTNEKLAARTRRQVLSQAVQSWVDVTRVNSRLRRALQRLQQSGQRSGIRFYFQSWTGSVFLTKDERRTDEKLAARTRRQVLSQAVQTWVDVTRVNLRLRRALQRLQQSGQRSGICFYFQAWVEVAFSTKDARRTDEKLTARTRRQVLSKAVPAWVDVTRVNLRLRRTLQRLQQSGQRSGLRFYFQSWAESAFSTKDARRTDEKLTARTLRQALSKAVHTWVDVTRVNLRLRRALRRLQQSGQRSGIRFYFQSWTESAFSTKDARRTDEKLTTRTRRQVLLEAVHTWVDAIRFGLRFQRTLQRLKQAGHMRIARDAFAEWVAPIVINRRHEQRCGNLQRAMKRSILDDAITEWLEFLGIQRYFRHVLGKQLTTTRKRVLLASFGHWEAMHRRMRQMLRVTDALLRAQKWHWTASLFDRWEKLTAAMNTFDSKRAKLKVRVRSLAVRRAFNSWVDVHWIQDSLNKVCVAVGKVTRRHDLRRSFRSWLWTVVRRRHLHHSSQMTQKLATNNCLVEMIIRWQGSLESMKKQQRSQTKFSKAERKHWGQTLIAWRGFTRYQIRTRSVAKSLLSSFNRNMLQTALREWTSTWLREKHLRGVSRRADKNMRRQCQITTFRNWVAVSRREGYLGWAATSIMNLQRKRSLATAQAGWQMLLGSKHRAKRVAGIVLSAATKHWVWQSFNWWLTLWRRADRQRLSAASVALFKDSESKTATHTFRAWHAVSQRAEQLQWSYSASCRVVKKTTASTAFSEWVTVTRQKRSHSRKLHEVCVLSIRNLVVRSLVAWAQSTREIRYLQWLQGTLGKSWRRRQLCWTLREWMAIGRRGERRRLTWALATLGTAHEGYSKASALREWSNTAKRSAELRHMDEELSGESRFSKLSASMRGWVALSRSGNLLKWAGSALVVRTRRFLQAQVLKEWAAAVQRQEDVNKVFAGLARKATHQWAIATLMRMIVFLAGGMDSAASQASARAQVVTHHISTLLDIAGRQRMKRIWAGWAGVVSDAAAVRHRNKGIMRMTLRRQLGGALGAWRESSRLGLDSERFASMSGRSKHQAKIAVWLMAWIGVVKRGRHVLQAGEALAGRQLMATMAGTFLRWRRFALWEPLHGKESMEETLGDAVWESVGDKVRPSDAHEWAARGLWGANGGAETLCASDLVVKVKVGVAKTVGRWFGDELLSALVRLHGTEDALLELGGGLVALKAAHARELEAMSNRLMELESVLLALLATSGSELSTDPALGLSPSLSRFKASPSTSSVPVPGITYSQRNIIPGLEDMASDKSDIGVGVLLDKVAGAEDVLVKGLVPGGLAARTGLIRQNDVLESVNGERVRGLGLGAIYRRMQGREGSPVFLQLARRGCSHLLNAPVRFQVSFVRSSAPPPAVVVGQA